MTTTTRALAAALMLAATGCYGLHELAGTSDAGATLAPAVAEGDAGVTLHPPPVGDGPDCHVRYFCWCDERGACSRLDGTPCQANDLRDPSADPCLRR